MNRVYWLKGTSSENFQFTDEGFLSISNQKKKKLLSLPLMWFMTQELYREA